jgi:hypothetical protein
METTPPTITEGADCYQGGSARSSASSDSHRPIE